jgi:Protein of unknown function (DUF3106)
MVRPFRRLAAAGVLALLAALPVTRAWAQAAPVAAAVAEQGKPWLALSPAQRSALAPLQGEWSKIDAARKEKWLELAGRMPSMPAADRERIQVRMSEWVRMSPAERGRARLQFQESRQLSAGDRQQRWEDYKALPADQRRALADKAAQPAPAPKVSKTPAPQTSAVENKRNLVTLAPPAPAPKTVAPTVVQGRAGATTSLVTQPGSAPAHHQTGLPKIAATRGFVDPETLLPRRGPQGAAVASPPAANGNKPSAPAK